MFAWIGKLIQSYKASNAQAVNCDNIKERRYGFCYAMDGLSTGEISEQTIERMIDENQHHPSFLEGMGEALEHWQEFEDSTI